jgi:sugar/nucleoside kinase (ribokinase family)
MKKKYDVTAAGHICLDIIPEIPETGIIGINELFRPGKLIQVNAAKISTGGPVSNTGIALKKLGLNIAFMSRIGNDEFGELIIKRLTEQGETTGLSVVKGGRTSYTIALAPPGIDRIFLHDPGANDSFNGVDLDEAVIKLSKVFHFGYPPLMKSCFEKNGEELKNIMQLAKSAGAITSLDMSLPDPDSFAGKIDWNKILEKVLPFVDIFLPSIEEAFFMLDPKVYLEIKAIAGANDMIDFIEPSIYSQLAETCLKLGSKIVGLKTAHRGFYVQTKKLDKHFGIAVGVDVDPQNWSNRELWCPAYQIEKIASATGSGDSSIAGFLAAMLKGESIERALQYANCVGFQNLHELDALSGIQNWEQTTKMVINEVMKLREITLAESGWKWDEKMKLWIGKNDRTFY